MGQGTGPLELGWSSLFLLHRWKAAVGGGGHSEPAAEQRGTSVTRARALGGWWERSGNSQLCLFPMEWSPEATFSFLEEAVCLPWKQVHL